MNNARLAGITQGRLLSKYRSMSPLWYDKNIKNNSKNSCFIL
jgi:hypothetical protein